ncbi:MAG: arylesterase [Rhizobiaceae bacterium]
MSIVVALIWGGALSISNANETDNAPLQIVGFGDSLMAGYELPESDGFPAVLQAALKAKGLNAQVANAGVSGDTTTGGLERLDWSVPDGTKLVILELGANDALRGISPQITRDNLDAMITRLKERNIAVVLAGMLSPPNMGKEYEAAFNTIHPELAAKHNVPLIPFFLEGVAGNAANQLADRMHPNRKGVDVMVENAMKAILPEAEKLIAQN